MAIVASIARRFRARRFRRTPVTRPRTGRSGVAALLVALLATTALWLAVAPTDVAAARGGRTRDGRDDRGAREERNARDGRDDDRDEDDDEDDDEAFTEEFGLDRCTFASQGRHTYFILEPGYQLVFEGREDGDRVGLTSTVLADTKTVAGVQTRIVEERHTRNNELIEVSRNYFAICTQTNSVIYFGEDVDNYENGAVVNHDGSWLAGRNGAKAGVMMPGIVLLGARYYQEIAPGVALDRAEIESISEVVRTPAGRFERCLKTEETTPLEPTAEDVKLYAPGVGLVEDGALKLVRYGQRR